MKLIKKPYPFNSDLRHNARVVFFISLGLLLFLLIFQPIKITALSSKQILHLTVGLAITTFLVLSINLIILPSLLPKLFNPDKWNVLKEIFWNLWMLLSISASDLLLYSNLFGVFEIEFSDIGTLMLMGFIPVSVIIIVNQDRLLKSHLKSAMALNQKLMANKTNKKQLIQFKSDYQKDHLTIDLDSLILVKSADNYIEVIYQNDKEIKSHLLRSSMKKTQDVLHNYDQIVRCHRSSIVNINYITEIKGNSQGYRLSLKGVNFPVLVSQQYINIFKKRIQTIL